MKENKKFVPFIIGGIVIVLIVIILILFLGKGTKVIKKGSKEEIKNVSELIKAEYNDVECIDDCNFFYAYKGSDDLTGMLYFFNNEGKKLGSYDLSKVDPKVVATMDIEGITKNYYIMSYTNVETFDSSYIAYNMNGKVIIEADDIEAITENYFTIEKDDKKALLNNKGKVIYENVDYVKNYNDEYITLRVNEVDKIIDKNGNEILSGYTIAKVVLNDNDDIDYLIVKNTEESVYYYFNVKEATKKGDAFTSYTEENDQMIISKKVDSKTKKFILKSNGEQIEYSEKSTETNSDSYYSEIKSKIDTEKYPIFSSTVKQENQNYVLVDNKEENKFGIYDIKNNSFKELGSYKEGSNRRLTLKQITTYDTNSEAKDVIFSVECTSYYCDHDVQFIYNFTQNKLLLSRDSEKESLIYSIKLYDNNYYVVRNTSSEFDDSSKYVLYDDNNEKVIETENDIKIIENNVLYNSSTVSDTGNINLYSLEDKKIINLDSDKDPLYVSKEKFGKEELYQFGDDNNTYLLTKEGKLTKLEGKVKSSDDIGIYLSNDKKVYYYNVYNEKLSSYELQSNESINGSTGRELVPFRNAIFVNNSYDNLFKVIGIDNKVLLEKKNLQIYSVETDLNGNIIITVVDKDDNKGIYIAK